MANPTDIDIPHRGRKCTVWYAEAASRRRPAKDYIHGLDMKDQAKLFSLIYNLAEMGTIRNPARFKRLDAEIFELKISGHRILCFPHGGDWYLTHGCGKVPKKAFQREIERAKRIREDHLGRGRGKTKGRRR